MFEKNTNSDKDINTKVANIYIKDNINSRFKDLSSTSAIQSETDSKEKPPKNDSVQMECSLHKDTDSIKVEDVNNENSNLNESSLHKNIPEKVYKSNIEKFNFLQAQLSGDSIDINKTEQIEQIYETEHKDEDSINETESDEKKQEIQIEDCSKDEVREDCNITDDIRIAKIPTITPLNVDKVPEELGKIEQETKISVPPRRKKQNASDKKTATPKVPKTFKVYPDHLNPFSDDEEEVPFLQYIISTQSRQI